MPRVEIPQGALRTVAPQGDLAYQRSSATPDAFGAQIGTAEQRVGGALEQGSDVAAKAAIAFQGLKNETMAKEADITASKAMAHATADYFSSMGKNAVDGFDPTVESVEKIRKEHIEALPNQEAKKMFDQAFYRNMTYNINAMSRHAAQQNKVWMLETSKAREDTAISSAVNYYNDDVKFNQAVLTAKDEALQRAELQYGAAASPEIVNREFKAVESKAWAARVMRTMVNEPLKAQEMYRDNIGKIDGAAHTQLEHAIKSAVQPLVAKTLARNVMSGRMPVETGPILREVEKEGGLFAAMETQESSGDPGAVSKKGALGVMQLMPDTARDVAKSLNMPFDEKKLTENTPEGIAYNRALGQEYFRQMAQRYGGNQTMALAAYNAGPARVDAWVARYGDPNTGQISDADWAAKIPFKETRDYVAKITAKVPVRAGTAATSGDARAHLAVWVNEGKRAAAEYAPNDPVLEDMVVSNIQHYVNTAATAQAGVEKASRDLLVRNVAGSSGAKNMDELLRSPENQEAWRHMDGQSQIAVMSMVTHNSKGQDPPLTPESIYAYSDAMGRASRDPQKFKDENLGPLYAVLPHHLTLGLINLQAAIEKKDPAQQDKMQRIQHVLSIAAPMLRAAGIDPHAKVGSSKAKDYDQFVGRMQDSIDRFVAENKKAPNDDDARKMAQSLLTQGVQPGGAWFGMADKSVKAFQVEPGAFKVVAPPAERQKIIDDYKRIKGAEPSQMEIDNIYTISRLRK